MTTIEFPSKGAADAIREEYPDAICPDDDARLKTVRFRSDAPEHVIEDAERRALQERGERDSGAGQSDLTAHERDRIDFSAGRASVPHARSVKAIAEKHGVDDWLAYYDPTLTVDEHREVMERAGREEQGQRMDSHEERLAERAGHAAARAEGEQCDHARGHCRMGDPEACEFLRTACGFGDEEIEQLATTPEEADDAAEEITGKAAGALQRSWGGYQAGTTRLSREIASAREAWQHAQRAARAINSIRAEHGQDPLHFEALTEAQGELVTFARQAAADCHECHGFDGDGGESSGSEDVLETDPGEQQALTGEPAETKQQARLAVDPDVREAQGRESRVEAEQSQGGLLADTRSDPSRGADSDGPETAQQTFRDPEQQGLTDS